jgi:hypothetical protein
MKYVRRILTVGALALMYVGVSAADTVQFTSSFGPSATDFTHTFTLSDFDPTLGTLTGVEIDLSASETISALGLANTGNIVESNFSVVATSAIKTSNNTAVAADNVSIFTLNDFDSSILFPGGVTLGDSSLPACPLATPSAACSSVSFTPPAPVSGTNSVTDTSAAIVGYIGLGTFSIDGITKAFSSFSGGGGNIALNQSTNATLSATVIYTYTAANTTTPEPATLFLMGSALVGVGLLRKRIKS